MTRTIAIAGVGLAGMWAATSAPRAHRRASTRALLRRMMIRTDPFAASLRRLIDAFALAGLSGATMLLLGMVAGWVLRRMSKNGPADRSRAGPKLEPTNMRVKATRHYEIRWPDRARARRMEAVPRPMQQGTAKLVA